jgi:hypothetical protein
MTYSLILGSSFILRSFSSTDMDWHGNIYFSVWHILCGMYENQCDAFHELLGWHSHLFFYIEYATCFSDVLLSRSQLHLEGWSTPNKTSVAGGGDELGQRKLQMMDMALSPMITKDLKLWRLDPHDMSQYLSEWGTRRATWANIWCSA